jgi:antitoxin component YwqK of YwqJK toxin-antitoxin module
MALPLVLRYQPILNCLSKYLDTKTCKELSLITTDYTIPSKVYDDNGSIRGEFTYINGITEGPYKLYWQNGNTYEVCSHLNGKKEGLCKLYYENGSIEEECSYINGKLEGPCKSYWQNGSIWEECTYIYIDSTYYKDRAIRDGPYKSYWHNGQLQVSCLYSKGELVGRYKSFHIDGSKDRTYKKIDGKFHYRINPYNIQFEAHPFFYTSTRARITQYECIQIKKHIQITIYYAIHHRN